MQELEEETEEEDVEIIKDHSEEPTPVNVTYSDRGELGLYYRDISREELLTIEQEIELAKKAKGPEPDASRAKAELVEKNLRLVVNIAKDYANYGVPLADLVSEGNIGLIKAVERYDLGKGAKLSTYAAWWIKQSIKRALSNQGREIRLPVHIGDKINKIMRIRNGMAKEFGRNPTNEEIAEITGIPEKKIRELLECVAHPVSLNAPIGEDSDNNTLADVLKDNNVDSPEEIAEIQSGKERLQVLFQDLPKREQRILTARFGLDGNNPKTLEEVGLEFNVTRERIRQLQNIALRKLKKKIDKAPNAFDQGTNL